jgi:hypothetical protein
MRTGLYETRVEVQDGIAERVIDGRTFLVTTADNYLHRLNEVGTHIWALLHDRRTVGEIIDSIVKEYEVDREVAERDCYAFLQALRDKGIVKLEQPIL